MLVVYFLTDQVQGLVCENVCTLTALLREAVCFVILKFQNPTSITGSDAMVTACM